MERPLNAERKVRLEAAGFKFGTVRELFNLSEAEELLVEMKVAKAIARPSRPKKSAARSRVTKPRAKRSAHAAAS